MKHIIGRGKQRPYGEMVKFDPDIHHRRSIRLKEYDYSSAGAYFITICTQGRECLFGEITDGMMHLSDAGRMVAQWWLKLPDKFPGIVLDEHVVMPNHFHGVIVITDSVGAPPCGCPDFPPPCGCTPSHVTSKSGDHMGIAPTTKKTTVGGIMDWFKTMTTNGYIDGVKNAGWRTFPGRLWQRNYYERIIRDDAEMNGIREYIQSNPACWANDAEYAYCPQG